MAETKNGFTPLKDNLEIWINKKIKEIAKLKQKKYRDIENKYRSIQAGEC